MTTASDPQQHAKPLLQVTSQILALVFCGWDSVIPDAHICRIPPMVAYVVFILLSIQFRSRLGSPPRTSPSSTVAFSELNMEADLNSLLYPLSWQDLPEVFAALRTSQPSATLLRSIRERPDCSEITDLECTNILDKVSAVFPSAVAPPPPISCKPTVSACVECGHGLQAYRSCT